MSLKRLWWSAAALLVAAGVGGAVATGVTVQRTYANMDHGSPYVAPRPSNPLAPNVPGPVDMNALRARLDGLANDNEALARFGAQVIDSTDGAVVWERSPGDALVPASSTKVLTATAATWQLPADKRLVTSIVRGAREGEVVIKASGDVWMTLEQLDRVAEELGPQKAVFIDTSVWTGEPQAKNWDPDNVDAGFVAPMEPAMVFGARLGATDGDVPRSHTPALDVARLLARRVGAETVGFAPASADATPLAEVVSPPLSERAELMMKHSDNVMAEAIGREIAIARGKAPSFEGATQATLDILAEHEVDTQKIFIADNSGLSDLNRITPAALAGLIERSIAEPELRAVLGYLPVAGGDGTLYTRYSDLPGRGLVRAKTGTLTGVSALVGTAQGNSGHLYAFAFLVNDGDVTAARRAQDELASALREF